MCKIHIVTEVDTNVLKKLISNFCYIGSINNKAENEHKMACILWCVCCCWNMKILLGTVLKLAAFPQILQPVDKQGKSQNNVFSLAPYCLHLQDWAGTDKVLECRSSRLLLNVMYWNVTIMVLWDDCSVVGKYWCAQVNTSVHLCTSSYGIPEELVSVLWKSHSKALSVYNASRYSLRPLP